MKVLVTGAAGFIGFHVARRLASSDHCEVLGVDNLGAYGDPGLKRARLAELAPLGGFRFLQADFAEMERFAALIGHFKPDYVVHLGAQTGVRHSAEDPPAYIHSNLVGFASVIDACRRAPPKHLVYASSSSVYGSGCRTPFREDDSGSPTSFYGVTKKCNEAMAASYVSTHGIRVTGLRFFSVYGPWGRPDMAPTLFARAISEGRPLPLFNQGKNLRDFTYVDDIVDGVVKALLYPADTAPAKAAAAAHPPHRVFNLGHQRPVETLLFVRMLEELLGRTAKMELLPAQPGEMTETCADLTRARAEIGFSPRVPLEDGLKRFIDWFKSYYGKPVTV